VSAQEDFEQIGCNLSIPSNTITRSFDPSSSTAKRQPSVVVKPGGSAPPWPTKPGALSSKGWRACKIDPQEPVYPEAIAGYIVYLKWPGA
jgi:hypothetical protein